MTINAMFCLVPDLPRCMTMLCKLDELGLATDTISILLARDHVSAQDRVLIADKVIEDFVGTGTHIDVFDSLGPLLVIGPLQERLRAAVITIPTARSFVEAMMRLGVPPGAATCYGGGMRQGRVLLSIHTRSDADREALERMIAHLGGHPKGDPHVL